MRCRGWASSSNQSGTSKEAYEVRRAKLGPDDPKTLGFKDSLAVPMQQAGKLDPALPLLKES